MKGVCIVCGAPLPPKTSHHGNRMYCSKECAKQLPAVNAGGGVNKCTIAYLQRGVIALDRAAVKAKAIGLSYGEAVARGLL